MDEKEDVNYPASNLIYEVFKKEYDYELSRIQKVDTKINVGLSLCVGLFLFILKLYDYASLFGKSENIISNIVPANIYVMLSFIMAITYLSAFILLLSIFRSRKYMHIQLNEIKNSNLHREKIDIAEMTLVFLYEISIDINIKINNKRMKVFNVALILLLVVILIAAILQIMSYNAFC